MTNNQFNYQQSHEFRQKCHLKTLAAYGLGQNERALGGYPSVCKAMFNGHELHGSCCSESDTQRINWQLNFMKQRMNAYVQAVQKSLEAIVQFTGKVANIKAQFDEKNDAKKKRNVELII